MRESGSPQIAMRRIATWLALLIAALTPAAAHDLFRSESRLVVQGREVSAQLTFNLLDFPGVDQNGDKVVTPEEFAPAFERVYATILQHFTLNSSGPPVRITRDKYELFDQHVLLLDLTYVFPQQVLALQMTSTLPDVLGPGHVHLVNVRMNGRVQEQVLDSRNRTAFFTQTSGAWWQTLGRFVWLGIQHIATGYDHLAFLLGLLIATGSMRSLIKTITSFTVAHSITLALATFNIVVLAFTIHREHDRAQHSIRGCRKSRSAAKPRPLEDHFPVRLGTRLWIFKRPARNAAAARRFGAVAVLVQPGRGDRAGGIRGVAVPGYRGPDPLRLDQAAPRDIGRDRTASSLLVHPARFFRMRNFWMRNQRGNAASLGAVLPGCPGARATFRIMARVE